MAEEGQQADRAGNEHNLTGGQQNTSKTDRDLWDKIEILGRPVAALLTAVTVAIIGMIGQSVLQHREEEITFRAAQQQSAQLYTELMSRREESEASLRADMFAKILDEFFVERSVESSLADTSDRLLKLEMLALNFGESLSLSPVFLDLDRHIRSAKPKDIALLLQYQKNFTNRLTRLARRVASWQVSALSQGAVLFTIPVPLEVTDNKVEIKTNAKDGKYKWPDEKIQEAFELNFEFYCIDELGELGFSTINVEDRCKVDSKSGQVRSDDDSENGASECDLGNTTDKSIRNEPKRDLGACVKGLESLFRKNQREDLSTRVLGNNKRQFRAAFSKSNYDTKEVSVQLEIRDCGWVEELETEEAAEQSGSGWFNDADTGNKISTCKAPLDMSGKVINAEPVKMSFTLDFFNFPMIDNTRLTNDQRFALVMEKFSTESVDVRGILFPGLYASQRDKPFLDVVIRQLQQRVSATDGRESAASSEN